ncbi:adenylyl-sulfate kinase [Shewanella sp. FJAT-52076]|uniref:adenylyl-sulfate kinase n=1 Tax=Shewanella sp. FJAT-52076 TaxID=2864202 RepID=UPI001C658B30|nr:adenylyl-sulfate kinase [Shewanella sp. FJAT-52076]QYJ74140.1 adenylyl-sulfate kinase [Shewanella sp. FJAT-52076]
MTGQVIWITGLPGAGKTTFSCALIERLSVAGMKTIHLDGDALRQVFSNQDYSQTGRLALAMQYAKLAGLLAGQGAHVVISTVSMFHQIHQWNRLNLPGYFEVFLNPPFAELKRRNQKGLYHGIDAHNLELALGMAPEFPKEPDLKLDNTNLDEFKIGVETVTRHCLTVFGAAHD